MQGTSAGQQADSGLSSLGPLELLEAPGQLLTQQAMFVPGLLSGENLNLQPLGESEAALSGKAKSRAPIPVNGA